MTVPRLRCVLWGALCLSLWGTAAAAAPPETVVRRPAKEADVQALKTRAFNKWMRSWHPINRKLKVADVPGMGRGLIAATDIEAKEKVLAIPLRYVFCRETIIPKLSREYVPPPCRHHAGPRGVGGRPWVRGNRGQSVLTDSWWVVASGLLVVTPPGANPHCV